MVNPVREVSALVSKGCASSIALYLAQIPLIVAWLEEDVLRRKKIKLMAMANQQWIIGIQNRCLFDTKSWERTTRVVEDLQKILIPTLPNLLVVFLAGKGLPSNFSLSPLSPKNSISVISS